MIERLNEYLYILTIANGGWWMLYQIDGPSHQEARSIMKDNYLGFDEVRKFIDIPDHGLQLNKFKVIPFEVSTLQEFASSHILLPDFGLSIIDLRRILGEDLFYSAWFLEEDFSRQTEEPRWILFRKRPVPLSQIKSFDKQKQLLAENEEVPSTRSFSMALILYWLCRKKRLFSRSYVRTNDIMGEGKGVYVGKFSRVGLFISVMKLNQYDEDTGLSSVVKT